MVEAEESLVPMTLRAWGAVPALQGLAKTLNAVFEDVAIQFSGDGILIRDLDVSRIAMMIVRSDSDAFELVEIDGKNVVGVATDTFNKYVSPLDKNDDYVEFSTFNNMLRLSTQKSKIDLDHIRGIRLSSFVEPSIPYAASATMYADDFLKAVKKAEKVNEYISVEVAGTLYVSAYEDMIGKYTETVETIATEGTGKSLYAAGYIKSILKGVAKDTPITVHLGNDIPIKVEYNFMAGNSPLFRVTGLIVPRVED